MPTKPSGFLPSQATEAGFQPVTISSLSLGKDQPGISVVTPPERRRTLSLRRKGKDSTQHLSDT